MASALKFMKSLLLVAILSAAGSAVAQDELRRTFFKDVDAALEAANAVDARLLAPRSYSDGMEAYEAAEEALERGRNIEYVRRRAGEAEVHFETARTAAELAKTALAQVMKSRQDAANAKAPELAREVWDKAQREFGNAIRYLERGDLKTAKRNDIEATSLYRDAELIAIKAQYLSETRRLLADADRARVGRYAPITLGKAQQLLADAERELNENRYDTDLPRNLARQANYEAKHAIYLSEVVRDVRDKDLTVEELVPGEKLVIRANDSYEARGYLEQYGFAKSEKCYMLRGVAGAFMDLIYGGAYPEGRYVFSAAETFCRAKGDAYCEFIARKSSHRPDA